MEEFYPKYKDDPCYKKANEIVEKVVNDPEGRYQLRVQFYDKYGDAKAFGHGLGNSELAFLKWEIKRGVLNPMDWEKPGSNWWRAVNTLFLFASTYAAVLFDEEKEPPPIYEVQAWYTYIKDQNAINWYRAHNSSISKGYERYLKIAWKEDYYERQFVNMVLYRLLFAGALNEGEEWGKFGEIIANPRLPSVLILVQIPDFYPDHYPLTKEDIKNIMGKDHSIVDLGVKILDDWIILPQAEELYAFSSKLYDVPSMNSWIKDDEPCYALKNTEIDKLNWFQKILRAIFRLFR